MNKETARITETFNIILSKHARLDCFPLRFGKVLPFSHGKFTGYLDEEGTENQKPKEIKSGNQHYVGEFVDCNNEVYPNVRFVLAKPDTRRVGRTVISVLLSEIGLATRAVTDLVRALRQEQKISPEQIATKLYPLYNSGKISNEIELFEELVRLGVQVRTEELQSRLQEEQQKSEEYFNLYKEEERKAEDYRNEIISKDRKSPEYQGEKIDLAPVCTLKDVKTRFRTNSSGKTIKCTYLYFFEDVPARKMDEWADPFGETTRKAQHLIGKQVITTTWKPETFSPRHWFKNIYPDIY